MNVFLTLHACQPVVGDSQNQNMNLSLPIIGAFRLAWHGNSGSTNDVILGRGYQFLWAMVDGWSVWKLFLHFFVMLLVTQNHKKTNLSLLKPLKPLSHWVVVHTWGLTAFRSSATVKNPSGVWSSLSLKWSPCTLAAWQVWHLISYADSWSQGQWLGSHCVDLCQHLVADWAWRLLVFREGGEIADSCWQYHQSYHGLLCYPWVPGAWNPGWTRRMDCLILVDMGLKRVTQT